MLLSEMHVLKKYKGTLLTEKHAVKVSDHFTQSFDLMKNVLSRFFQIWMWDKSIFVSCRLKEHQ